VNIHASNALRRRHEIAALVKGGGVRSQEDLQRLLAQRGIVVTQPTLSRDLKDLAVVKSPSGYALASGNGSSAAPVEGAEAKLARVFSEFAVSVETAGNLVVVKTSPGTANAVADAADAAPLTGVVGTLAGDNTIFFATKSAGAAARLARTFGRTSPRRRARG
jgi:transcriptional regulator of arginine metabolism